MRRTGVTAGVRRSLAGVLVIAALASGRPAVEASVVVPMSLAQLAEAATLIVDATVADVRHVEGPEGAERLVLVRVASVWKGAIDDTAYVRLAGGRIGRFETRVSGVPSVDTGDRLVWFLAPHPRGGYAVLGLHQGAMRTTQGPGGETFVLAPPRGPAPRGDLSRVPRRLGDLADDVRSALGAGAAR